MAVNPAVKTARRQLVGLTLIIVVLAGLIGLGVSRNEATLLPKLALDLQGGTQILLAPKTTNGESVSPEQVQQAVGIIRQRVDASGVSEAEITTQGGTNILVSIPGRVDEATLNRIESSARLDLRAVYTVAAGFDETSGAQLQELQKLKGAELEKKVAEIGKLAERQNPANDPAVLPDPQPTEAGSLEWVTEAMMQAFEKFNCLPENAGTAANADPKLPVFACDEQGQKYILGPVEITGDSIDDASAGIMTGSNGVSTGQWGIDIRLDQKGTKAFAAISQRLVALQEPQNMFAFIVDGSVISAPRMQATIVDGRAQISGAFTQESAQVLADQLKHGALPLSFTVQSQEDISATLGSSQLAAGLIAGLIGLVIVVIYSLFQYRALGLLTVASLLIAGVLTYLALTYLSWRQGYRLSLAGVTGIIVAIGFTADSFIVYFERVRDALRDGMPLESAVSSAWKKAFRTILASDAINFLAAAILFLLAIGNVRGFAFTLGLTTLIDLIVVALFTHPMLTLMARTRFWGGGHPLSGLDPQALGASYRGRGQFAPRQRVQPKRKQRGGSKLSKQDKQLTIAERKAQAAAAESKES